jgi:hypothetical protein
MATRAKMGRWISKIDNQGIEYALKMATVVDGALFGCQIVNRQLGPTYVCAGCRQGIAARGADVRDRCRVCKRKLIATWYQD